MTLNIN